MDPLNQKSSLSTDLLVNESFSWQETTPLRLTVDRRYDLFCLFFFLVKNRRLQYQKCNSTRSTWLDRFGCVMLVKATVGGRFFLNSTRLHSFLFFFSSSLNVLMLTQVTSLDFTPLRLKIQTTLCNFIHVCRDDDSSLSLVRHYALGGLRDTRFNINSFLRHFTVINMV